VIYREEVTGLLFAIHDLNRALWDIHRVLLEEGDGGEEEDES
jgi:hypothetical protein